MMENLPNFKEKSFKQTVVLSILELVTKNSYELVSDFKWLVVIILA